MSLALAAANITTTTSTVTFTRTTIQQLPATPFLGIDDTLWLVIIGAILAFSYILFTRQVKGVPYSLKWIYKTGSALQLTVGQDLNGLFISVMNARGKKLETLTKDAEPLEVTVIPPKVEFYMDPKEAGTTLDADTTALIESKGFKVKERREGRKQKFRGYLVYNEPKLKKVLAFLDVSLGGLRHVREYATIEGSGTTVDWMERAKDAPVGVGKNAVIHEEISAGKSWLHLLAEAAQGSRSLLIGAVMGGGIAGTAMLLVFLLAGFHR